MKAAERRENLGVLRYLAGEEDSGPVSWTPYSAEIDRWRLGAHPDVIDFVWDELNQALPGDGRVLLADTAALVDPTTGLVVALALGTSYAVRVGRNHRAAREAGYRTSREFRTVGRRLDLERAFGPGWFFGQFDRREVTWLRETGPP